VGSDDGAVGTLAAALAASAGLGAEAEIRWPKSVFEFDVDACDKPTLLRSCLNEAYLAAVSRIFSLFETLFPIDLTSASSVSIVESLMLLVCDNSMAGTDTGLDARATENAAKAVKILLAESW